MFWVMVAERFLSSIEVRKNLISFSDFWDDTSIQNIFLEETKTSAVVVLS